MIYISAAFKEEAKPLLQQWQFKRDKRAPCKLYVADDICLLITQMGQKNASRSLEALLSYLPPKKDDIFINFGICAAPINYEIGEVLECGSICYEQEYITLKSESTCILRTLDSPESSVYNTAVDMEAFALFKIALPLFKNFYCIKVVSDHFEPLHVKKETIATLLDEGVSTIKEIVHENRHSNGN